ncbi:MAG: uroporphyrinogen-III synthase [Flavobacteriaceae bacterium]|nr:uroporphyrinogen-III synthase [Flavobacteriaceae bacterium]
MSTPTILSTKALQPAQRSRLLAAGFSVQSYNAVAAEALTFDMPAAPFQGIFTSQNAVAAFLSHEHLSTALPILEGVYCVGERSAQKLRKKGVLVHAVADSAADLEKILFSGRYALESSPLYYLCGNRHLHTLPNAFKAAKRPLNIRIVYETNGVEKAFDRPFEALFFFSPSGVAAFTENNKIGDAFVVAIGPTTAQAVAAHTKQYVVAKKPSFAHMLSALRAHYPKKDKR